MNEKHICKQQQSHLVRRIWIKEYIYIHSGWSKIGHNVIFCDSVIRNHGENYAFITMNCWWTCKVLILWPKLKRFYFRNNRWFQICKSSVVIYLKKMHFITPHHKTEYSNAYCLSELRTNLNWTFNIQYKDRQISVALFVLKSNILGKVIKLITTWVTWHFPEYHWKTMDTWWVRTSKKRWRRGWREQTHHLISSETPFSWGTIALSKINQNIGETKTIDYNVMEPLFQWISWK